MSSNTRMLKKFVSILTKDGKKVRAFRIVCLCFRELKKVHNVNPVFVFQKAILNVIPSVEVQKFKKGSQTLFSPKLTSRKRRLSLAIRWIFIAAQTKNRQKFVKNLTAEVWNAFLLTGKAYDKKIELNRKIESNRNFLLIYENSTIA